MADFKAPDTIAGIDKKRLGRDTRTTFEQVWEGVTSWDSGLMVLAGFALAPYVYEPLSVLVSFPVCYILYRSIVNNKANLTLPVKLPIDLNDRLDYHDAKPGGKKFNKANGTVPFGNLRKTAHEMWFAGKDLLTHILLIGTTGAGKTDTLVSLSASSTFATGSGLVYVDAKAAPKLIAQFFTLARIFGREDDLRVINYMTGNKKVSKQSCERLSNSTNPFALGSADSSVQMLISLLPTGGGDNQVFLDRAISMVTAVMPVLVELRERGIMTITADGIREYIQLDKFIEMATGTTLINDIPVKLSAESVKCVTDYLLSIPGYVPNSKAKQPEEVSKQFGFGQMYFTRALSNLGATFGHIYGLDLSEVDFADIILNGRILIVLVPAMEQAGESRKALGKVVLSSIRNAMALGLGSRAEGFREDVLESLPIDLKTPSMIIVDEYAEVATEGFAVTATQGRGLGMSVVFAGQDLAGFERASKEDAEMIFSNTRIKALMALEDPNLTWQRFKDLAGDMSVVRAGGWQRNSDGVDDWRPGDSASAESVGRLNLNELKAQTEGQAHVFERSNIHKVQMFHHGIDDKDLVNEWRINRMIRVRYPRLDAINNIRSNIDVGDYLLANNKAVKPLDKEAAAIIDRLKAASNANGFFWAFNYFLETEQRGIVGDADNDNFVVGGNAPARPDPANSAAAAPGAGGFSEDMTNLIENEANEDGSDGSIFDGYDPLSVVQPDTPAPAVPEPVQPASPPSRSSTIDEFLDRKPVKPGVDDRDMPSRIIESMAQPVPQVESMAAALRSDEPASLDSVVKKILGNPQNSWVFQSIQAAKPTDAPAFVEGLGKMFAMVGADPENPYREVDDVVEQLSSFYYKVDPRLLAKPMDQDLVLGSLRNFYDQEKG